MQSRDVTVCDVSSGRIVPTKQTQFLGQEVAGVRRRAAEGGIYWRSGDAIDRRPLAEGVEVWRSWFDAIHRAGIHPHALLEFVRGDEPENLVSDALQLRDLMPRSGA